MKFICIRWVLQNLCLCTKATNIWDFDCEYLWFPSWSADSWKISIIKSANWSSEIAKWGWLSITRQFDMVLFCESLLVLLRVAPVLFAWNIQTWHTRNMKTPRYPWYNNQPRGSQFKVFRWCTSIGRGPGDDTSSHTWLVKHILAKKGWFTQPWKEVILRNLHKVEPRIAERHDM